MWISDSPHQRSVSALGKMHGRLRPGELFCRAARLGIMERAVDCDHFDQVAECLTVFRVTRQNTQEEMESVLAAHQQDADLVAVRNNPLVRQHAAMSGPRHWNQALVTSVDRANCETLHPPGMHRSVEKAITHNLAFRRNASNGPSGETLVQGIGTHGIRLHHVLRSALRQLCKAVMQLAPMVWAMGGPIRVAIVRHIR